MAKHFYNGIYTPFCSEEITLDSQNRYVIDTPTKLDCVRNRLTGSYILGSDINMSGINFEPIGSNEFPFKGIFDGAGYKIIDLNITNPEPIGGGFSVGLFGTTQNSKITNLGLENVTILDSNAQYVAVGSLVGTPKYTEISNCYATGVVNSSKNNVGGLIGSLWSTLNFSNNYFIGSVTGNNKVGGLVGNGWGGTGILKDISIKYSFADANVVGNAYVGGLIGASDTPIYESYSTGTVSGIDYVGGLISKVSNITNSYSLSDVIRLSGDSNNIGGFVTTFESHSNNNSNIINSYSIGQVIYQDSENPTNKGFSVSDGPIFSNNFWDTETSNQLTSALGATGKTTIEMKQQSTFIDWNFTDIWNITEGTTYPYLRNNVQTPLPE